MKGVNIINETFGDFQKGLKNMEPNQPKRCMKMIQVYHINWIAMPFKTDHTRINVMVSLGLKHSLKKEIHDCSNEEPFALQREIIMI